jgi:DNA-binding GntR family transcriptional regulator
MNGILGHKVSAQSLVDALAERIEAAIVSGDLQPGSKLSEQALATSLGVSRGPLREAIRRLEGRKLLQRTPNIGVRVASLSLSDLYEVLQVREALEGLACGLAATNMTDEELKALSRLLQQQHRSVQETGFYQESMDFDFHFQIVKGSRNARLVQMLCEDLYYLLRVYRSQFSITSGHAKQALREHKKIVAALIERDPVEAERKMRLHIGNACLYIEEQMREAAGRQEVAVLARKSKTAKTVTGKNGKVAARARR